AGAEHADRYDRRLKRVDIARDDRLKSVDDLRTYQNRIDTEMRSRRMCADTLDIDGQRVGGRHHRSGADPECADGHPWIVVHPENFLDTKTIHQPIVDHGLAATAAFFRRLEDDNGRAREIPGLREIAGSTEQHGGMAVMAAGVHLSRNSRLVRQVVRFLDRKRIHVGAQANGLAGHALLAPDNADHAGAPEAGHDLVAAERLELLCDGPRRAVHVVLQLGMHVQIAPPLGNVGMKVCDAVHDRHDLAPWRAQCSKSPGTGASSGNRPCWPIDRAGRRPYTDPSILATG